MMRLHTKGGVAFLSIAALAGLSVVSVSALTPEERQANIETRKLEMRGNADGRQTGRAENMEKREAGMETKRTETDAKRQEQFCARFISGAEAQKSKLSERYQNTMEKRSGRSDKSEEQRSGRDTKLDGNRVEQDAKRAEWYGKLLERAGDDADKKAAVEAFRTEMEAAVEARRKAVDAAIVAFRAEADTALGKRKSGVDGAATTFKSAADAAIAKAKSSCDGSVASAEVRTQFMADMKAARDVFQSSRQSLEKAGEEMKALAATRSAAIKSATDAFKAATDAAQTKLRAAFGATSGE